MIIDEIEKKIQEIKNCTSDPEKAHSLEDDLYHEFIRELSKGVVEYNSILEKAKMILSTEKLEFPRWCA